jgi:hypothetical protein
VDEASKPDATADLAHRRSLPPLVEFGRPEFKGAMRPLAVVVVDVDAEHAFEVTAVKDQQPVETLGTHSADEALRDHVRLRCPGNVDHVVWSDRGVYAIETKSGRLRHRDLPQAIGNAVWVKQKFGARWVTAVLCVAEDPPTPPREQGYAWVLGPDELQRWLRGRPRQAGGIKLQGMDAGSLG